MVIPRSRSISIESSTCSFISRAVRPPVSWIRRSERVDLPWSMWATMEKLRIWLSGVDIGAPLACFTRPPAIQPALRRGDLREARFAPSEFHHGPPPSHALRPGLARGPGAPPPADAGRGLWASTALAFAGRPAVWPAAAAGEGYVDLRRGRGHPPELRLFRRRH